MIGPHYFVVLLKGKSIPACHTSSSGEERGQGVGYGTQIGSHIGLRADSGEESL